MIRIAKVSDPQRLLDLKEKIQDDTYMNDAIYSIAHALTGEMLENSED